MKRSCEYGNKVMGRGIKFESRDGVDIEYTEQDMTVCDHV
jgi:hypothetical protein